jgi:hypothetical protein
MLQINNPRAAFELRKITRRDENNARPDSISLAGHDAMEKTRCCRRRSVGRSHRGSLPKLGKLAQSVMRTRQGPLGFCQSARYRGGNFVYPHWRDGAKIVYGRAVVDRVLSDHCGKICPMVFRRPGIAQRWGHRIPNPRAGPRFLAFRGGNTSYS